jgi:hypothetical protein
MEVQYTSQIKAIGTKATDCNLDVSPHPALHKVQSIACTFKTDSIWLSFKKSATTTTPAMKQPGDPSLIHEFLQSTIISSQNVRLGSSTVSHPEVSGTSSSFSFAVGADEFPGKDPLYDCFIAALDHIEREPARHLNREDEASQGSRIEALRGRMQQLESLALQKDFVIKSKDELLRIKEETLVAHKELMSEKGRVVQVCLSCSSWKPVLNTDRFKAKENELKQARTLIANSKNTQEKKNTMQNLKNTMFPKDQNIERLQGTIDQKNRIIEELQTAISRRNKTIQDLKNIATLNNQRSLEQRSNDTNVTLRKDEIRTLENQLAHRDHVVRTLEFAYENLEKSSEERITALWDEIKNKDEKIVELQNARGRYLEDRKYQTTSDNEGRKIKKEKKPKIKPEPMEY